MQVADALHLAGGYDHVQFITPDVDDLTVTVEAAGTIIGCAHGHQFRVDKAGIIHGTIGRRSFGAEQLTGNLRALLDALNKSKPASSKGIYLRKVAVSSTMGVGVRVDISSLTAPAA